MATFDCRMIDVFPTSREPMRGFVDRMKALQGRDGVLSVSLIHGFMAGDVAGDGDASAGRRRRRRSKGDALARALGMEIFAMRGRTAMPMLGVDEGLDQALRRSASRQAGRSRRCLGQSRRRRRRRRHIDPAAHDRAGHRQFRCWRRSGIRSRSNFCRAAGEGATLQLRFGGKAGPDGGAPIDATVEVLKAVPESWQSFGASRVTLGPTALVRLAGTAIEVILNTNRTQTFEPDIFSNLGVDPARKAILLVKSTNHFYAGFAPIAAKIIYIDAGAPTLPIRARRLIASSRAPSGRALRTRTICSQNEFSHFCADANIRLTGIIIGAMLV